MKSIIRSSIFLLLVFTLVFSGCDKEIEEGEQFAPLQPVSQDEDAATWDMIILTSPSQVSIPLPASTSSDSYIAELQEIRKLQAGLTKEQQRIIDYWSSGSVVIWNKFMRELVARYNLPPAPLSNGVYPVPDPENPFADPAFPFANPPYAARAYSYVSVAQFEALKSAWHYKFLYKRPSPHVVDDNIRSLMPSGTLPAYPSEEAVLSGVTAELLKALFPASVREITLLAAEQRNAALWSGKASFSDITAGLSLGKEIARLVLARAAGDGMRNALGTRELWQKLEDDCIARGEMPWKSLEIPARPPMLPFFGNVKGWNMTYEDFVKERPPLPPSTSSEELKEQTREVKYYAENLTRERLRIVHKWADGVGTYTPPGHWNDIATEYIHAARFSEVRTARAYALLNMAMHDAVVGCWETKFFYFNPRPSQVDPSIKTVTGVPNFPAYTSGHSTFSGAAATVLAHLFPAGAKFFSEQANEASLSRLYGGIHYRADIEMGLKHGEVIGGYTVDFALTDGGD